MCFNCFSDRMNQEKKADQARELWGTCQDLSNALKASKANDSELKPLQKQINAIRKAAGNVYILCCLSW